MSLLSFPLFFWLLFAIHFHFLLILAEDDLPYSSFPHYNETQHCLDLSNTLFEPTAEIDKVRLEWKRFFPAFVKTQLHDVLKPELSRTPNEEVEFPQGHERFNVIGPLGPSCKTPLEQYSIGDDAKKICGLQELQYMKRYGLDGVELPNHECVIYSLGCNNQWGFEDAIVTHTSCRVETFDCTVNEDVVPPEHLQSRVRLHRVCLSDHDFILNGLLFLSWDTINILTGVQTAPTFLKMDIEGYEFPVLKSIVDSGKYLPHQIAVEIHTKRVEFIKRWEMQGKGIDDFEDDWVNSLELHSFFEFLHDFGGYYPIHRRDNEYCAHCTEILFAKLNCQNHPRPANYQEILLDGEHQLLDSTYEAAVRSSLETRFYS